MCVCAFKKGYSQTLVSQGFTNIIPSSSFGAGSKCSEFAFLHCVNADKVYEKLNTIKVKDLQGNQVLLGDWVKTNAQENLKALAKLSESGEDIKYYGVKLSDLLGEIVFTPEEIKESSCKIAFATEQ